MFYIFSLNVILQSCWLVIYVKARPNASPSASPVAKPYYYYGGPGYYQGHYLRGLPGFPGYKLVEYRDELTL